MYVLLKVGYIIENIIYFLLYINNKIKKIL